RHLPADLPDHLRWLRRDDSAPDDWQRVLALPGRLRIRRGPGLRHFGVHRQHQARRRGAEMIENRLPSELRARLETNPFRHQSNYVEWQGHKLLSETVCKRCGTTLSSIGPDPRIPPRRHELADTTKRTIIMETYTTRLLSSVHDT